MHSVKGKYLSDKGCREGGAGENALKGENALLKWGIPSLGGEGN